MRLATFNRDRIGLVEGDQLIDVTATLQGPDTGMSAMRRLIHAWDEGRLPALTGPKIPLSSVRLEAPVPDPTKILAAPVNYRDHQAEMNEAAHVSSLGLFLKSPSSLVGADGIVQLPYGDRRFDQEGELAVIIGRRARKVSEEDALMHVFGYSGLLDITMRGGEDRSIRKSFETFTPMGPWLVTADEFGSSDDVRLQCWVNGDLRQEANTADLIWNVARLVSYASWVTTLEPGDVLSTGTPAGVGPLGDGDDVLLRLSGVGGDLSVGVSSTGAVNSHTSGHNSGPVPPPAPDRSSRGAVAG